MNRYAQIVGWGMCVPERVVTNDDLTRIVDTSDEWIWSRTGIRERHIASDGRETTATLALKAARAALRVANLSPGQLDLIIVATISPEYIFPSTASLVQDGLGASRAGAFDLSAGCSGFVYGLSVASDIIRSGGADHALVIGAETLSRFLDWSDRNTCVLFGDGAGAVILSTAEQPCGVLASVLGSDGSGGELLILPGGGSKMPPTHESVSSGAHFMKMNGREVFRFASTAMPKAVEGVAKKAGWSVSELDQVIPHQANSRIIDAAIKRLELPAEKFFVNLDRYGNTSAASIPIALCESIADGRVHAGDKLVLVGFGAGLTWGAVAIEWGIPVPTRPPAWWRRLLSSILFGWAGVRSVARRSSRHAYNWVLGPVGKDDWRGRLRRRADTIGDDIRRRRNGSPDDKR